MKKTTIFWAVAALMLLTFGACQHPERMIQRYSLTDTALQIEDGTIYEFTWNDGQLQQVMRHNPSNIQRPEFEDWDAFFNYTIDYGYENNQLKSMTGNKYRTEFTYDGDKLVRIDQFSIEGNVHAYRVEYSYEDENTVNAVYYEMSSEAIKWLECNLYPRNDSTGTRVLPEMPEDTTLSATASSVYKWENGNLVYTKTSYGMDLLTESRMEYDNKVNPFYNTHGNQENLNLLLATFPWADNSLGVSKNNMTKISFTNTIGDKTDEGSFTNTYEYDGDYPVVRKCSQNAAVYHYEYVK